MSLVLDWSCRGGGILKETFAICHHHRRSAPKDVYHRRAMNRAEDRYLVASLEFEGVLRACLHRYARNIADVDELLQETWAHLLAAGAAQNREEIRSIRPSR